MANYDRQLIIVLLTDGAQDAPTLAQAKALNQKTRGETLDSEIVTIRPCAQPACTFAAAGVEELRLAVAGRLRVSRPITASTRVYLVGTGNWQHRTLSGCTPEQVAAVLGEVKMMAVKVISIVADSLGRSGSALVQPELAASIESFAALFHRRLKENWQIQTVVQARVMQVTVVLPPPGVKSDQAMPALGQKVTTVEGETRHHRPNSKVKFLWEGEAQRAEWAY
ncbi:hypothetical protein NIES2100_29900 [Calothrix sp. NIES-2100]|nr:hypothetical protein NIES2100_29900 [Calothrix sp. NIES-2100]